MNKPNLHPEERRFYQASTFYMSLTSYIGFICFNGIDLKPKLWILAAIVHSYQLSRLWWKINRGHFYSGFLTSEFYFSILHAFFLIHAHFSLSADPFWASLLFALNVIVYNQIRGFTLRIGKKTQYMMRI